MNAAQLAVKNSHAASSEAEVIVVSAVGEIDLTTVLQLREPILRAVDSNPARLIVDLSEVDFIDSAGLSLLKEAHTRLRGTGIVLALILTAGLQPERVFRLGRFDTIMYLCYSLDEALKGLEQTSTANYQSAHSTVSNIAAPEAPKRSRKKKTAD